MIDAAETPEKAGRWNGHRPRIALAHDWLCGYRGGEAVLERIAGIIERIGEPAALFTMFDDGRPLSPAVNRWRGAGLVRASWLNHVPGGSGRARRWLLPAYPSAVAQLGRLLEAEHRRRPIDLLVSSSSAAIKGLRPPPGVPHLCYCHSPARYVWSRREEYGGRGLVARFRTAGLALYAGRFKRWDRSTASNVTRFVANSAYTASQIGEAFGAPAEVVHPPVRTLYFTPEPGIAREAFWLVVSALEPYKRIDLAIDAAAGAGKTLLIAGRGSHRRALERRAGPHVTFLGRVGDDELRNLYRRASVLLFPQVEDFGIVAVEALACGLPVAARAAGGALDIVRSGTGALFNQPDAGSLAGAAIEATAADPRACRLAAEAFSEERFDAAMTAEIWAALAPRAQESARAE